MGAGHLHVIIAYLFSLPTLTLSVATYAMLKLNKLISSER